MWMQAHCRTTLNLLSLIYLLSSLALLYFRIMFSFKYVQKQNRSANIGSGFHNLLLETHHIICFSSVSKSIQKVGGKKRKQKRQREN